MGRPQKDGLDYMNLDVALDTKMELIEAAHGLIGFAVVVKLWQKIYGGEGYYYQFGRDEKLLFCKHNNIPLDQLEEILNDLIARGIFSEKMYSDYSILTSSGIQKRYFEATKKRASLMLVNAYLLVSAPKTAVYSPETPVSDADSTQRKEKKRREDEEDNAGAGAHEDEPEDTPEDAPPDIVAYCQANLPAMNAKAFDDLRDFMQDGITPELIKLAVDKTRANGSFAWHYASRIPDDWVIKGVKTVEAAESVSQQHKARGQPRSQSPPERDTWMPTYRGG